MAECGKNETMGMGVAGWDIPGEPGNQVPTKSLFHSEIFARNHVFLFNIQSEEI